MIGFVLDDAGRKVVGVNCDALALAIERADRDLARLRHAAAYLGDAETSFPVFDDVAADDGDLRVDDRRYGSSVSSSSSPALSDATKSRSPACTCGAARPTP